MENEKEPGVLGALFERTGDYLETRTELFKLKAVKKVSETVSSLTAIVIVALIMLVAFIVLTVGLSLWIGDLLGKSYYGFFAVGGLYVIVGIIIFSTREKFIKVPVANSLIKTVNA